MLQAHGAIFSFLLMLEDPAPAQLAYANSLEDPVPTELAYANSLEGSVPAELAYANSLEFPVAAQLAYANSTSNPMAIDCKTTYSMMESLTRSELSAQELSKPELERQLLSKVHWTALAIDSTKIRPEEQFLLELLRLNPDDPHLPDSEADIWKKWLNADAGITEFSGQIEQGKREVMLTRASQFKDSCLNTKVTERFRRAYTSEWKDTITKYLEYPPYYETIRAQDFDFPLRQKRICWFWEGILSSTFSLLQGISQGSPDALDTTTLETLATLSIPRSQDSVHDLYYSSNGQRNPTLLVRLPIHRDDS
ncbi:hypothetical protein BDZ91DRAFT_794654 [Kalaharituber pfeilii]|nr:hypothetical protein BDZ91DRAFT_794654 [Kalaharituber pfeilii]